MEQQPSHITLDAKAARQHLMRTYEEHKAAGGGPVVILWAIYGTGSFNAAIEAKDVPDMLKSADHATRTDGFTRKDVKDMVYVLMRDNKHFETEGKAVAPPMILWLACRNPEDPQRMVEKVAVKGDCAIGFQITSRPQSKDETYVHFRMICERL